MIKAHILTKIWLTGCAAQCWLYVLQWLQSSIVCVCVSTQAALKQATRAPFWKNSQRMRSCVSRGWKRMLYIPSCPATMVWLRETESFFSKWKTFWLSSICPTSWTARWEWGRVMGATFHGQVAQIILFFYDVFVYSNVYNWCRECMWKITFRASYVLPFLYDKSKQV